MNTRKAGELSTTRGKWMIRNRLRSGLALCFAATVVTSGAAAPPTLERIAGTGPEYPPIARRYNVSGVVIAKIRIEPDGQVSKTEILDSPAEVLSDAVIKTTSQWRYRPIAEAYEGKVRFPFQLTGADEDSAFSTRVRSLVFAPSNAKDLGTAPTEGVCHARVLIDGVGSVYGSMILKTSDEFRASCEEIVSTLKFESALPSESRTTAVNLFFIAVLPNLDIRVNQYSGD